MRDFWHRRSGESAPQPPAGAPSQPPPPPLPPVSAEYESTVESAQPGATPQQFPWKLSRSGDGKMRVDHGEKSVINNPAEGQSITLDHVKKEALAVGSVAAPRQDQAQANARPGGGQGSAPPALPNVKDLGKKIIADHEAEGKLYTFQPPSAPQPPAAPAPTAPQPPGAAPTAMPQSPTAAAPQAPKAQTVEVWTSKKLGLPLLTKSSGAGGDQTDLCKKVSTGEPPASAFQVPPGYKMVKLPEPPKPPEIPKPPEAPKLAKLPDLPKPPGG